jgi:hypothetical protein
VAEGCQGFHVSGNGITMSAFLRFQKKRVGVSGSNPEV